MPGTGKREFPCILCRKRTKPTERRTLTAELNQLVQKLCVSDPSEKDVLCTACRIKCHVKLKKHIEKKDTATKDRLYSPPQQGNTSRYARSPPSVTLPLPSSATSHARCFICKRPGPKLINVPTSERNSVFLHQKILIPYGSRCCTKHIPDGRFTSDALKQIPVFSQTSSLNRSSIVDILLYLRETALIYDNLELILTEKMLSAINNTQVLPVLARIPLTTCCLISVKMLRIHLYAALGTAWEFF